MAYVEQMLTPAAHSRLCFEASLVTHPFVSVGVLVLVSIAVFGWT